MKSNNGELYEDWCERARIFELDLAQQRLKNEEDAALVLEEMTYKLLAKMMHPLFDFAKDEIIDDYDPVKSREEYKKLYLDKISPRADHVEFDGNN